MSFNESILSKVLARTIISSAERSEFLSFATPVYCPDINGIKAQKLFIIKPKEPTAQETGTVDSETITVDLTDEFKFTMNIPHEVDLKTNFNMLNIIRSFAYQMFKREISNAVSTYVFQNSDEFTTTTAQTTLAASVGEAFGEYVYSGTGDKISIYKYDNGAPVTYSLGSNEIALNKDAIMDKNTPEYFSQMFFESVYNDKNSNEPAYYLLEKPTVLFNENTAKQFFQQLASGDFKRTMADKFEVAVNHDTLPDSVLGVLGTNNVFAVGFTEPKVSIVPDTAAFQNKVKVYISYGVSAVNKEDLVLISNITAGG